MHILITICARGGSKGIIGKNIRMLNGKPLIYYTVKTALEFSEKFKCVKIVLSTDDEEILNIVEGFNVNVDTSYIRPDHLASDTAGKLDAIKDVLKYFEDKNSVKYDYVIDLDVTSPLRTVEDIRIAFDLLLKDPNAFNIFSVSTANRNPYFNMVEKGEDGYYKTSKSGSFLTRQTAPKVYEMNASFYIYASSYFCNGFEGAITDKSLVYEVPHLCFDLDHIFDFEFIEFLVRNNKLDFEL